MVTYANAGEWEDITDSITVACVVEDKRVYQSWPRMFFVRCGGCPRYQYVSLTTDFLAEHPMPGALTILYGWQAEPLRCTYCLGIDARPDTPNAAPYPSDPIDDDVAEGHRLVAEGHGLGSDDLKDWYRRSLRAALRQSTDGR